MKLTNLISAFAITIILISCADSGTNQITPNLDIQYKNAVNDAIIADDDEIVNDLIAITKNNSYIKWKNVNGKSYVLALTFTPYKNSYPLGDTITTSWGETWVTIVPEMKDVFKSKRFENDSLFQLAIQQLLGLPATSKTGFLVEFWVDPDSLFRPAPDNEITDSRAELQFPDNAAESYKTWFNNKILTSYFPISTSSNKYPWTRLGYTYNWTYGQNDRGLSEFVLKAKSSVIVNFAGLPAEYLKK